MGIDTSGKTLTLTIGHDELIVRQRWEVVSIVNDIAIAVWFIAGSVLFFSESTTELGTVLFLVGSIELLVRPVIRLVRRVHIRRVRGGSDGVDSLDF
ncbi:MULTISPECIES: YrhK family protein [unclassified Rhodococcus (in: high G+C Gram-positive bacteria)]|uniref:YrhK family protein n=1 Tax=unclassified Rhodococcus (in: high G+C Gram-positive bacteria) TaxID=192944 RepID=UPI0027E03A30|nr:MULTISPECIES: YrhK family protein [unclassified Rhodococcus (in: high G+C Gram-positive bacteria)]